MLFKMVVLPVVTWNTCWLSADHRRPAWWAAAAKASPAHLFHQNQRLSHAASRPYRRH